MVSQPPIFQALLDGIRLSGQWVTWLRELVDKTEPRTRSTGTITSDYTARAGDLIEGNPTGGAFSITLPINSRDGDRVRYKNISTSVNTVTFLPGAGDTIDGAASVTNTTSRGSDIFTYSHGLHQWHRGV